MDKVAVVVGKLVAKWKATSAKQKSYLQRRVDEAAEASAEAARPPRRRDEEPGEGASALVANKAASEAASTASERRSTRRRRAAAAGATAEGPRTLSAEGSEDADGAEGSETPTAAELQGWKALLDEGLIDDIDYAAKAAEIRDRDGATDVASGDVEPMALASDADDAAGRRRRRGARLAEAVVAGVPTADEAEDLLKVFSRVRALGVVEHDRLHGVFHVLHLVLKQDFEFQGRALVQARNLTKVGPSGAEAGQEVRKKLHHVRVRLAGTFLALLAAFYADEAYPRSAEALSATPWARSPRASSSRSSSTTSPATAAAAIDTSAPPVSGEERALQLALGADSADPAAALEEEDYGGGLARGRRRRATDLLLRHATERLSGAVAFFRRPRPPTRRAPPPTLPLTEQDQALQAQQDVLLSERAAILLELGKVSDEKAGLVAQGKVRALRNTATFARNCDAKAKKLKASRDKVGRALSKINKQRRELQRQVLAEAAESDDESFNSADCDDDDSSGDFDSASESDDDVHIRNHDAAAFSQSDDESDDDGPAPPKRSKTPPPGS
ncbi:hypothetical protein JL721_8248 [Aureococcus anophagefferens]|nr:hypothetical protein JL721_8248 [Aureococcus anophagefferens]